MSCLLLEPGEVSGALPVCQPAVGQGLVHCVAALVTDHEAPLDTGDSLAGDAAPGLLWVHELSVADLILDIHILHRASSVSLGAILRRISVSHAVSGKHYFRNVGRLNKIEWFKPRQFDRILKSHASEMRAMCSSLKGNCPERLT